MTADMTVVHSAPEYDVALIRWTQPEHDAPFEQRLAVRLFQLKSLTDALQPQLPGQDWGVLAESDGCEKLRLSSEKDLGVPAMVAAPAPVEMIRLAVALSGEGPFEAQHIQQLITEIIRDLQDAFAWIRIKISLLFLCPPRPPTAKPCIASAPCGLARLKSPSVPRAPGATQKSRAKSVWGAHPVSSATEAGGRRAA
ncbi:hypothetical protein [Streptomyces sp. NPDC057438]|uniref:hypothetical protein n=1 Tax=Streptomyces sp. NPDC057438 TaxID=3346133 RepID=UPI0036B07434